MSQRGALRARFGTRGARTLCKHNTAERQTQDRNERLEMSCPETLEELIDWFPDFVQLPLLLEYGNYETYAEVWNDIYDHHLGWDFTGCAWVTRTGQVWTCGWAKHEQLLSLMGLNLDEVEKAGWMRVSRPMGSERDPNGYICNKVSAKQKAFAKRNHVKVFEMWEDEPLVVTPQIESYENATL